MNPTCPAPAIDTLRIEKVFALRGPNIWANFPVLEAWVDLGTHKDLSSELMPGFNENLIGWLPTMIEHHCSPGERGGFFQRLERGTYLAHILEHVTLELQTLAGNRVGFGRTRETSVEGVYRVAIEYDEEAVAREALAAARRLLLAAISNEPFDLPAEIARLVDLSHEHCLGPSTAAIVAAAEARSIPWMRLNDGNLIQLGHGSRQRRIWTAETDRTSAIAEAIAKDKDLTRRLLLACGVPVPAGRPVASAEEAWEAAEPIGLPVAVKPRDGNHGRGVSTGLTTRQGVLDAYRRADGEGNGVIVEQSIPGHDHRLLVIGERLIAAARRVPAHVIGDGIHTVSELVAAANCDPRRCDGHATSLTFIPLDEVAEAVLAEQGMNPASVPPAASPVFLRRTANLSTGGTAIDVTDLVHPETREQAIDAARAVGLDVAGIDLLAEDIAAPLRNQGGAIIEVNAGPGLRMHLDPSEGQSRPVGEAIVETLFEPGESGLIPIVAVTGTNGKTTTTRLIARILATPDTDVAYTCTDGIYVSGRRTDHDDCSGPRSARSVLMNPRVDAAVFETARGGILREGLGFRHCDVAVVTNIGEGDHLGLSEVNTPEDLARVKRCIVEALRPGTGVAVLNADDPLVASMAEKCPGRVVYFSRCSENPLLRKARKDGERVVFARDASIVFADGSSDFVLSSFKDVPFTREGAVAFQVENALAASAAAWALGVPCEVIRSGLSSFGSGLISCPARFNLIETHGRTVVFDYGHNTSALRATIAALDQFAAGRRLAVYSAAGDRRDEDLIEQGALLGNEFDSVVLYEDQYLRGRNPGDIIALFRAGLATGTRCRTVAAFHSWIAAAQHAISSASAGDLVLIQADTVDETTAFEQQLLAQEGAELKR